MSVKLGVIPKNENASPHDFHNRLHPAHVFAPLCGPPASELRLPWYCCYVALQEFIIFYADFVVYAVLDFSVMVVVIILTGFLCHAHCVASWLVLLLSFVVDFFIVVIELFFVVSGIEGGWDVGSGV